LVEEPREAARLGATVAHAVHFAHQHGILHRDLKPANVLLDRDGQPHVTDFGLVRRIGEDSGLTQSGAIVGTPAYMPPEQASGRKGAVTTASDVYSLGAVLYELLTGRPPFGAATVADALLLVLEQEPKPPRSLNDRIPRDLEASCLKAMAKEPSRRYATAGELAADLRRWLSGKPIVARPVGRLERSWRWARRHPSAAGLVVAVCVGALALVAAGVGFAYNARLQRANRDEAVARQQADSSRKVAERALELADRYLYILRVNQAGAAWRDDQVKRVAELLDACPAALRGWEWHYLDQLRRTSLLDFRGDRSSVHGVVYSPVGRRLASASPDGVRVWDAATGQEALTLRGHTRTVNCVAYSPDGRRLASGGDDETVRVWDAATGQEALTLRGHTKSVLCVAYSPDGRHLASVSDD
jgi:hypothetical protein